MERLRYEKRKLEEEMKDLEYKLITLEGDFKKFPPGLRSPKDERILNKLSSVYRNFNLLMMEKREKLDSINKELQKFKYKN